MGDPKTLTAREAADRLGIKLDTLYAYVSRGRLRSITVPGSRERRYRMADIEGLRGPRSGDRPARNTDAEAMMPTVSSSICLIENGRLYYRGKDAIGLADRASLEEVAELLWGAEEASGPLDTDRAEAPGYEIPAAGLIERCQIRLAILADTDLLALDLTRAGVIRTGRRILRELAAGIAPPASLAEPVHRQLAAAWGLNEAGRDILRRCLVLIADHEFNASTFVARCVASTGATPYAVVAAALNALSGRRHGGAAARAEALFAEIAGSGDPMPVMASRLARGEHLPGFGQFLYPGGDPRAKAILDAVAAAPEAHKLVNAAVLAGTRLTGRLPNVDFALAAAAAALQLPRNAALAIFVIGRTVGWIAHALEQYEIGTLIRPRARYLGLRPEEPIPC
jgi:citrate synthase